MAKQTNIQFRSHHFFCTLGFQGKGYSDAFVMNYKTLKSGLTDETRIEVVDHTDDICAPCPHSRNLSCEKEAKIQQLDQAHAKALAIKAGEVLTWGEAKERLTTLSIEDHHRICKGCEWLKFGLCEQSLRDLKQSEP